MLRCSLLTLSCLLTLAVPVLCGAQDRETKVRNDRKLLENSDHWIYNDLPRGLRMARLTRKPVLVVLRCIPCEACHEFDEQVVEREPQIRELLDKFVCVRIPQANGLDLSLFQYDYDMSFAVMFLHHDGTLLGRFGTRTGRDNEQDDMHLEGFAEAMTRIIDLEQQFDKVKPALAGKRGLATAFASPERFPSLKDKYTDSLDYSGKVVQSCIHCHQIREADRLVYRSQGAAVPDELLFPWPSLEVVGLKCDPKTATTVSMVHPDSIAAAAGLQPGDVLRSMNGQPLVSVADAQWVLQRTENQGVIDVAIQRGTEQKSVKLQLPAGWRKKSDIAWRVSTWDLRRMAFGGMVLESIPPADRERLKVPADRMALRVKHVGQYGDHARAKQAGFQVGDVLISYDDHTDLLTETDLLAYAMQQKRRNDEVRIHVLRGDNRQTMTLKLQ